MKVFKNFNNKHNLKLINSNFKFSTSLNNKRKNVETEIDYNDSKDEGETETGIYKDKFLTNSNFYNLNKLLEQNEIIFDKNNKFLIAKVSSKMQNSIKLLQYGIMMPLNIFSSYKFVLNACLLNLTSSFLWGAALLFVTKLNFNMLYKQQRVIETVSLIKDSTTDSYLIELKAFNTKKPIVLQLDSIKPKGIEEIKSYSGSNNYQIPNIKNIYIPIFTTDNKMFLLPKESEIYNKELFSSIINNKI